MPFPAQGKKVMAKKEDTTGTTCPRSKPSVFYNPVQIRQHAEKKPQKTKLPDPESMTREEIQQMFHEMQVKQLEVNLHVEQLNTLLIKYAARAELSTALDALSARLAIINGCCNAGGATDFAPDLGECCSDRWQRDPIYYQHRLGTGACR